MKIRDTWLLLPSMLAIWYPALGGIPPLAPAVALSVMLVLVKGGGQRSFPVSIRAISQLLLLFIALGLLSFFLQLAGGQYLQPKFEVYIFFSTLIAGPVLFWILASTNAGTRLDVLRVITGWTAGIVLLSIILSVGFDVGDFDKQSRIALPLVANSMASTSLSLVLVLLFATHLTVGRADHKRRLRFALMAGLLVCIWLMATRFVLLILVAASPWVIGKHIARRAAKKVLGGLLLAAVAASLIVSIGGQANERFRAEVESFRLVGDPLEDRSLAMRVVFWRRAVQQIREKPFGQGYMNFVATNVYSDPLLEWRGFNTHNEFLLQVLALGWLPGLAAGAVFLSFVKVHYRQGTLGDAMPLLIAIVIAAMFETYSNNPNAINSAPLTYMLLGVSLPNTLKGDGSM